MWRKITATNDVPVCANGSCFAGRILLAKGSKMHVSTQTSGQSNSTKRPHRRRTWRVQSYSPGGASVHRYLIHASLDAPESTTQNGISIGSAAFAFANDRARPTNRPTDHATYSICNNRPHLPHTCVVLRCGVKMCT